MAQRITRVPEEISNQLDLAYNNAVKQGGDHKNGIKAVGIELNTIFVEMLEAQYGSLRKQDLFLDYFSNFAYNNLRESHPNMTKSSAALSLSFASEEFNKNIKNDPLYIGEVFKDGYKRVAENFGFELQTCKDARDALLQEKDSLNAVIEKNYVPIGQHQKDVNSAYGIGGVAGAIIATAILGKFAYEGIKKTVIQKSNQ